MDRTALDIVANSPVTMAGYIMTGLKGGLEGVRDGRVTEEDVEKSLVGVMVAIKKFFDGTIQNAPGYQMYTLTVAMEAASMMAQEDDPSDDLAKAAVEGNA